MKSALEKILKNPTFATQLGQRLRERVQREFPLTRMVRETLAVYES
jgi:glycosyltransferase involved in cell wall biosynthesis